MGRVIWITQPSDEAECAKLIQCLLASRTDRRIVASVAVGDGALGRARRDWKVAFP